MMADVTGNVIALVFAALVALPVGPESAGWRSDVLLRDRSRLAVAETLGGTVLARVKALCFASTLAGAAVGLDPGCARRNHAAWATADGGALGSDSGLQRTRGLPHRGRHNFLCLGSNQGLIGQKPVEPVNVLGHNGGDHAVSWTRCSCESNCLAPAGCDRADDADRQDANQRPGASETRAPIFRGRPTLGGSRGGQDGLSGARLGNSDGREDSVVQRLASSNDRFVAKEDRSTRRLLDCQGTSDWNDADTGVPSNGRSARAAQSNLASRGNSGRTHAVASARDLIYRRQAMHPRGHIAQSPDCSRHPSRIRMGSKPRYPCQ